MRKYYIALMILGALTLGLTGYVLVLGLQSRQDVKTEKSAQAAAEKLNNYVSTNQKIPTSLSEAGVKDVPDTVKYTKLSEEKYKFCVTYKAAKGYGGGDLTNVITSAAEARYGGTTGIGSSDYEPSSLYLSYTHKKGEDCQTIKPYLYDSYEYPVNDPYCDPTSQYYNDYKTYCSDLQATPDSTTPKTTIQ